MKKLKLFNGNDWEHQNGKIYIAAHSRAEAARLYLDVYKKVKNFEWNYDKKDIERQCRYMKDYFHDDCWGNAMDGITPELGLWHSADGREKPIRIV